MSDETGKDKPSTGAQTGGQGATSAAKRPAGKSRRATGGRPAARTGQWLALLALLISIGVAGSGWWAWERLETAEARIAELVGDRDSARAEREALREQADQVPELDTRLSGIDSVIEALEARDQEYAEQLERIDQRTETLREFIDAGRSAWRLAEVDYLLVLANSEMQLRGRADTALAALEAADERLEALADPAMTPIREALAEDRARLRELEEPDVTGKAVRLSGLKGQVAELALDRGAIRQPAEVDETPEDPGPWQRFRRRGAEVLSDLVVIRHEEARDRPLLAPEQEYFLRRNLELQLATARLALLEEEPEIWDDSLAEARAWLDSYFDREDSAVAAFREDLEALAEVDIARERPELTRALDRLRARMEDGD